MSDYQAFKVELNDSIAHVIINRPEKVNAMNAAVSPVRPPAATPAALST